MNYCESIAGSYSLRGRRITGLFELDKSSDHTQSHVIMLWTLKFKLVNPPWGNTYILTKWAPCICTAVPRTAKHWTRFKESRLTTFSSISSIKSNNSSFSIEAHVPTPRFRLRDMARVPYACAQPYHPGSGSHGPMDSCFVLIRTH